MARRRLASFTPAEQAAFDVFPRLGDAARRGLHLSERVTARLVGLAAARAAALRRAMRRRDETLK